MKKVIAILSLALFATAAYAGDGCCPAKAADKAVAKTEAKAECPYMAAEAKKKACCDATAKAACDAKTKAACDATAKVSCDATAKAACDAKAKAACDAKATAAKAAGCCAMQAGDKAVASEDGKCEKKDCCPTDGTKCEKECCKEKKAVDTAKPEPVAAQ